MTFSIEDLHSKVKEVVAENIPKEKIGISFSGGVDSSLLAKICKDLNYEETLLTVGFKDSQDILFSKKINTFFKFPHKISEINLENFHEVSKKIQKELDTDNLSWNENGIAFYYVSQLAQKNNIDIVVTGNGIDELFCGYDAYRRIFDQGPKELLKLMDSKLDNELKMMTAINKIAGNFGVKILQPFLSSNFRDFSKQIPLSEKIHGSDDFFRKHAIRKLASFVGVPELAAFKRKKALQYGSLIHKQLLKSR